MQSSESELKRFIEDNLSRAHYFSCVVLYKSTENSAWYTAISLGEIIKNYFKSTKDKQINIHLILEINKIIPILKGMGKNDVLLLSIDNINIKPLSSYLVSETLNKKRNIIFISKDDNPISSPFKDITDVIIMVKSLSEDKLNCVIEISNRGQRELELKLPDSSLINEYKDLRDTLLKEIIKRQIPELEDQE